jgi:hypothetical protein
MLLLIMILSAFALIFVAGMHYAIWDQGLSRESFYYSMGLGLLGFYQLNNIVGYVTGLPK